ncbi:unnamed protein product [Rhizoctonia solani]|uniref:Uncharacterized protein n=1 Tax=Rhizoctonia solani TaxID=456999 RepID=A0A8H3HL89_9AGAM|nr:unnamed protein product [Rhizoctonia solani]
MQALEYNNQKVPVLAGYYFRPKDVDAAAKDLNAVKKAFSWRPAMVPLAILGSAVAGSPPYQIFTIASGSSENAVKDYATHSYIIAPVDLEHKAGATENAAAKEIKAVLKAHKPPVTPGWVVLKDQFVVKTTTV